ncbi:MAG: ATP-dependent helicase, partial [Myxococcota bacterium]
MQKRLSLLISEQYPHFEEISHQTNMLLEAYQQQKLEWNAMDFDDLLLHAVLLLRTESSLAEQYQNFFAHVLVDEVQDANPIQTAWIDLLCAGQDRITVVGDDAQSIYRFRGADARHLLHFPQRYPQCTTAYLQQNYRSTP